MNSGWLHESSGIKKKERVCLGGTADKNECIMLPSLP